MSKENNNKENFESQKKQEKSQQETKNTQTNQDDSVTQENSAANVSDIKNKKKDKEDPITQLRNDYLYLRAEFDNFKRNNVKERSELLKYGGERLASDLLRILDIFETALGREVSAESLQSFVDGVNLTAKELKGTLDKHGIREIKAQDKKFDPKYHEALTQVPNEEVANETVLDVYRKGYTFHEKVLRPAQVVVSKGSKD